MNDSEKPPKGSLQDLAARVLAGLHKEQRKIEKKGLEDRSAFNERTSAAQARMAEKVVKLMAEMRQQQKAVTEAAATLTTEQRCEAVKVIVRALPMDLRLALETWLAEFNAGGVG